MNNQDFTAHLTEFLGVMRKHSTLKGGEYSSTKDRLSNFKAEAADIDLTPLQVAAVYAGKHWAAIKTYVKDDATGTKRERTEDIHGRLQDLALYCVLVSAIIKETEVATENPMVFNEQVRTLIWESTHE